MLAMPTGSDIREGPHGLATEHPIVSRIVRNDGVIAILRLDNGSRSNALTGAMLSELEAHCEALEAASDTRAVILTSTGGRAFCAGADINEWGQMSSSDFVQHWVRNGHRVLDRLAGLSKPTIAAMPGPALGGGLEIAAACDMRIMARNAWMALPEASVGVVPGWSGTQRLGRLLPEPVIKEMTLFGRRLGAERAYELGFVAELAEDPLAAAMAISGRLEKLSSTAVKATKCMIHAAVGEDSAAMIDMLASGSVSAAPDCAEGVAAFREKRPPQFGGSACKQ